VDIVRKKIIANQVLENEGKEGDKYVKRAIANVVITIMYIFNFKDKSYYPPLSINKLGRQASIILYYLQLYLAPPANNRAMTLINKLISFALLIFIFCTSTVSICFSNIQNRFASLNDTATSFIILLVQNTGLTDLIFYLFFFC